MTEVSTETADDKDPARWMSVVRTVPVEYNNERVGGVTGDFSLA